LAPCNGAASAAVVLCFLRMRAAVSQPDAAGSACALLLPPHSLSAFFYILHMCTTQRPPTRARVAVACPALTVACGVCCVCAGVYSASPETRHTHSGPADCCIDAFLQQDQPAWPCCLRPRQCSFSHMAPSCALCRSPALSLHVVQGGCRLLRLPQRRLRPTPAPPAAGVVAAVVRAGGGAAAAVVLPSSFRVSWLLGSMRRLRRVRCARPPTRAAAARSPQSLLCFSSVALHVRHTRSLSFVAPGARATTPCRCCTDTTRCCTDTTRCLTPPATTAGAWRLRAALAEPLEGCSDEWTG